MSCAAELSPGSVLMTAPLLPKVESRVPLLLYRATKTAV
jgi:hypothetical protein